MILILAKLFLAPSVIALASWFAGRSGPRWGGFFVGLPTTCLPFMAVVWLAHGHAAALAAASGSLCGQTTCALFTIAYARTAPRLPSWTAMLLALAVAAPLGLSTLLLHDPGLVVLLVVAVAVAGLATWPSSPPVGAMPSRRSDVLGRMILAGVVVAVTSSVTALLGSALAGALASLPVILCVMCPTTHRAHGPAVSVALARGTLGAIPGTAALLCTLVVLGDRIGLVVAALVGLAMLATVNSLVARVSRLIGGRLPGLAVAR